MIRLDLAEFRSDLSPAACAALRAEFAEFHTFQIKEFLDPALLTFLVERLQPEDFHPRVDHSIATELAVSTRTNIGVQSLQLRMNDHKLTTFMEAVTGITPLSHFAGRVYRMAPGNDHYDSWHDDVIGGRRVGVSINLSPEPYRGGTFRIRQREGTDIIRTLPTLGPGDAIFFRIREDLLHMVTPVEGTASKTAFAGWFHDQGMLGDFLRGPALPKEPTPAS